MKIWEISVWSAVVTLAFVVGRETAPKPQPVQVVPDTSFVYVGGEFTVKWASADSGKTWIPVGVVDVSGRWHSVEIDSLCKSEVK
jgi:hypothetical protein